jgi:hypothetical protein
MNGDTELILAVIAEVRLHVTEGFAAVNGRLDILNGRTGRAEVAVGVLESRAEEMVCIAHTERFHMLERDASELKTDVATLQRHLAECAASPASKSPLIKWTVTTGAVAGLLAILEGIWAWFKNGTHFWVNK